LIVLGDLNDVPGSSTLAALTGDQQPGLLADLLDLVPEPERYSYVFGGQAEAIDHILVSPGLLSPASVSPFVEVDVVHGNADIVGAPSDHDPVLARFSLPPR
jgi:predicted extracellular nuclease